MGRSKGSSKTVEPETTSSFEDIEAVKLHEVAQSRYLNYALSVITSRALPDVRDGLKPVQRRILYAMYNDLKLRSDSRFLKSARVVGDVMGKYHPHGDSSIYEAMVRMSQPFSLRYPLVDGYGNFGSLDGDSAAAMRYTEARLGGMAERLLSELNQETIDRRANYDGQLEEPAVLPAQVPNLLINGATGIAVGMATHIPPHNLREVVKALLRLIKNPELSTADLTTSVLGPDFPTGGEILNTADEIAKIYQKGQGAIKVRGTYELEKVERTHQIVITSIPYEVQKGNLVEKIAQLVLDKRVPQIVDVRDESTDEVRIVLELKRGESAEVAMAYLYRHTPLQQNFNINLTCLVPVQVRTSLSTNHDTEGNEPSPCQPERLGLKAVLRYFLDFRLEVTQRRLQHELRNLKKQIHRLEAFEKIYGSLDEAIALIRESDGRADAEAKLMKRFELDQEQASAILEMRLYRLAKLEIAHVQAELTKKRKRAAECEALLADEPALWDIVKDELKEVRSKYGDERRTSIVGPQKETDFSAEAYILKEQTWLIVTRYGRVKRQRGFSDISSIRVPEGDEVGWAIYTDTRKTATVYTQAGSAYTTYVGEIPATTGYGDPLQSIFKFDDGEKVVGVVVNDPVLHPLPKELPAEAQSEKSLFSQAEDNQDSDNLPPYGIALTRLGRAHRFPLASFAEVSQKGGRRYMSLDAKDDIIHCFASNGDDSVALASRFGRGMIFSIYDIPLRQKSSKGCIAIRLIQGDVVLSFVLTNNPMQGLVVTTTGGREKHIRESHNSTSKLKKTRRGGRGYEMIKRGQFESFANAPLIMEPKDDSEQLESDPPLEDSQQDQVDGHHDQETTDSNLNDSDQKTGQSDDNSTNEEQS
ncbi:MAG: DNA topoisomerase [Myxococcales bacterium]|nr:DNA topoisomerase [Myxococcales bacterium]